MQPDRLKKFVEANRQQLIICFGLALGILVLYARVRHFGFVNCDDSFFVFDNPMVSNGLTLRGLWWGLTTTYFDFWHPLTWWSHMLDVQLFGMRAGGHHVTNVLLHSANSILLFLLLNRMTGAIARSAIVAALFAFHPLHVESVAWVSERKDVLSTFFWMLTLLAYVKYVSATKDPAQKPKLYFWLALGFYGLGLMAKSMLVTLPFVLLLLDYWPLKRWPVAPSNGSPAKEATTPPDQLPLFQGLKPLLMEKLPFFWLTLVSCAMTYWGMHLRHNILSVEKVPWSARPAMVAVSYGSYLFKAIVPLDLAVLYPLRIHWSFRHVLGATVILVLITLIVLARLRSRPYLAVGWFMFLGTLVPVIGIVPNGLQSYADRYMYIPSIGLFMAGVWAFAEFARRRQLPKLVSAAAAVLVLAICGVLTWTQVGYWRNSFALWDHCAAVTTENGVAHFAVGNEYQVAGRSDQAIEHFREAVRFQPNYWEAQLHLGVALGTMGRPAEATNCFLKVLEIKPDYAPAHDNLGRALYQLGDLPGALEQCSAAVRLAPGSARMLTGMAMTLGALGRSEDAMRVYAEALRHDPKYVEAQYYLGIEQLKAGKVDDAIASFHQVLQLAPNWADAHYQLALVWTKKRAIKEAIDEYHGALQLVPDSPVVLNNLAWLRATYPTPEFRNGAEAVTLAEHACALTSFNVTIFVGTLSAAYAEAGQFDKAVETSQKACDLASAQHDTKLLERNQELLRLFKNHQPYRESASGD